MAFRHGADRIHVTDMAVHVYRKDRDGPFVDKRLDLRRIHRAVFRADVAENGGQAAAHKGARRRDEGQGRSDDLPALRQAECPERRFQRQMSVGEEHQMRHTQILLQGIPESIVLHTHIGQDMAVPKLSDFLAVIFERRERSACNVDFHDFTSDKRNERTTRPKERRIWRKVIRSCRGAIIATQRRCDTRSSESYSACRSVTARWKRPSE